jgi:hypothetical protein
MQYAQCHLCSVSFTSPFALSVVMLNVAMLSVIALERGNNSLEAFSLVIFALEQ